MVTLCLCLFVMIYTTGKSTPQEIQLILSAFSDRLGFFEGGQTLSKGRMEEMGMTIESLPSETTGRSLSRAKQQAVSIFQPEVKAQKVRITEDERGLVISLVGADYFRPGSALLTPAVEDVLRKSAGLLKGLDRFVRVEGFSASGEDAIIAGAPGTARDERVYLNSWDLAGARSVNTVVFLQDQGVPAHLMQAVSFGAFRPMTKGKEGGTPEAEAHNRRIDIVILPFKTPSRQPGESGYDLPETRLPGSESMIPD
jgi:chemotaxis protein MotB